MCSRVREVVECLQVFFKGSYYVLIALLLFLISHYDCNEEEEEENYYNVDISLIFS